MIVSIQTKGKQRPRRVRGIVKAARRLGITRQHLYDVIHGNRRSRRIEAWLKKNMEGRE